MYDNITDGIGTDFRVYEGDGTDDGYTVYGSASWNGPWTNIGTGMGTTEFDLADASITSVRFLKILDDGTGNPSEINPGCDIDAVENLAAENANQPPNTPTQPTGPITGTMNATYSYSTTTTDPESQQVYYQWSWGDSVSPWLGPYESGVPAEANHSWSYAGDYLVKVKAKDIADLESGWSDPISVHIEMSPQIEIGMISGGIGISATVNNTGVGLATNVQWNISLDGGLILLGRDTTGTLSTIQPGSSTSVQSKFIFGIGAPSITVTAATAKKTVSAFILGPLVFIKK
jgi:hypothetical protein